LIGYARFVKSTVGSPTRFFKIIESCSPGPRLELFAREAKAGWTVWGNEAPAETGRDQIAGPTFDGQAKSPARISVSKELENALNDEMESRSHRKGPVPQNYFGNWRTISLGTVRLPNRTPIPFLRFSASSLSPTWSNKNKMAEQTKPAPPCRNVSKRTFLRTAPATRLDARYDNAIPGHSRFSFVSESERQFHSKSVS
jgi:hypothetical protein